MVRVSDLKTAAQVEEEARADPEVRRELDRTALANAVAIQVIGYRARHGLSQTQLARQLGMHQSAIARLEAGDHEPSLSTLARLARQLGVAFDILITPEAVETHTFDEVSGSAATDDLGGAPAQADDPVVDLISRAWGSMEAAPEHVRTFAQDPQWDEDFKYRTIKNYIEGQPGWQRERRRRA